MNGPTIVSIIVAVTALLGALGVAVRARPDAIKVMQEAARESVQLQRADVERLRDDLATERALSKQLGQKVDSLHQRISALEAKTDLTPVLAWQRAHEEVTAAMLIELRAIRRILDPNHPLTPPTLS